MRVLVTGGAGFIGSHLVEAYLAAGHEVAALDDLSSGHRENLPDGVELFEADVTDSSALESVFQAFKPELVSHHAAQINVRSSVEDPLFDARVNILGTVGLASSCVRHGVSKLIFASSGGAVYGEQHLFPAPESHPTHPLSPYGVSKLSGEHYLHCFHENWGLEYVALRYSNVYGPRQDPHGEAGVVAIFFTRMLAGSGVVINGDGEQTRDYICVEDVAAANLAASEPGSGSGIFNVGTGTETTVNELFRLTREIAGADCDEIHGPAKKGEQMRSSVDATLLTRKTGWRPAVSLPAGLRATFLHFQAGHRYGARS